MKLDTLEARENSRNSSYERSNLLQEYARQTIVAPTIDIQANSSSSN